MSLKRGALIAAAVFVGLASIIGWANLADPPLAEGIHADRVVVRKAARQLELYRGTELLRAYAVALGGAAEGPKQREGDERTPEGAFTLDYRKADSAFHRALHISYPSASESAAAKRQGVNPGGLIMVHGIRNGLGLIGRLHRLVDWTDGCIAVSNAEIEEIWRVVPDGTPILIEP